MAAWVWGRVWPAGSRTQRPWRARVHARTRGRRAGRARIAIQAGGVVESPIYRSICSRTSARTFVAPLNAVTIARSAPESFLGSIPTARANSLLS